jgi:hypothetical protein
MILQFNIGSSRLALVALAGALLVGCASVQTPAPTPTPETLDKLRQSNIAPSAVGKFGLAPGKSPEMDRTLGGLRGSSITPAGGTFSEQLKQTIVTELKAAGLYAENSKLVIEGQLTDSKVDAAVSVGTARLAAIFTVNRDGKRVYSKELAVDAQWESSFMGAVALPAAINQYNALYKKLAAKLFEDPEFRAATAR